MCVYTDGFIIINIYKMVSVVYSSRDTVFMILLKIILYIRQSNEK